MLRQTEAASYCPPRLSDEQMREIENLIWNSRDADKSVKPLLVWMLHQTEHFTRRVALSLWEHEHGIVFVERFQCAVHDMESSNGKTHIDQLFSRFGTKMGTCHHYGCLIEHSGKKALITDSDELEGRFGHTVWFSYVGYDCEAALLIFPGWEVLNEIQKTS